MKNIIFTDLDGTFLNHHNYSFEEAHEALTKISEKKIPLIFTTSKTKIEVELLQKKVGIIEPFIVENGAALFIPKDYQNLNLDFLTDFEDKKVLVFGKTYHQILNFYEEYKEEFGLKGFSDMDIQEISKLTGLDASSAALAKQREFTEPFVMEDKTKLEKLKNLASTYKIKITQGGRFFHLIGEKQDKGIAVKKTIELFEKLYNDKVSSIALGDGENDIKMLEVVDTPIVIKNHNDEYLDLDLKKLQKSTYQGSLGFNEMILKNV
jgi:mannosyl-3-phosphoglycerate phosphatase